MATLGVLITYYNEGEGLTSCLESLMGQPDAPNEILIYDDASKVPAESFIPKNCSVRVIRSEKNQGPGKGRNVLLKETQSEYIHFHDADDLFLPQWSEKVRKTLIEPGLDALFTEITSYEGEKLLAEKVQGLVPLETSEELVRFCLRRAILTSAGTYQTTVVREIGGYRESLWQSEDYDFHVRLAAKGISFRILSEPLIKRTQEAGRSREKLEVWTSALQALELLSEELPQKFHKDIAEASARISSILFKLGARTEARKGFSIARRLGPPTYENQQRLYRWVAGPFGPETAEWVSWFYRQILPTKFRSRIRDKHH